MAKVKEATAEVVEQTIPDEELENYGGNLAAWEGAGRDIYGKIVPLAKRGDYLPGSIGASLPDLNPPGTFVYKTAPDLKFNWAWWDDNGTSNSRTTYNDFRSRGYKPALASEWITCPELRDTIVPDSNDRLTFAASKDGAHVVMYQSEADYRRIRALITRESDFVQQSAEERASALQEELRAGGLRGVRVKSEMTEDASD